MVFVVVFEGVSQPVAWPEAVHRTEAGARRTVYDHAAAHWDDVVNDGKNPDEWTPLPEDMDAAIEAYFDAADDEYFWIESFPLRR